MFRFVEILGTKKKIHGRIPLNRTVACIKTFNGGKKKGGGVRDNNMEFNKVILDELIGRFTTKNETIRRI